MLTALYKTYALPISRLFTATNISLTQSPDKLQ